MTDSLKNLKDFLEKKCDEWEKSLYLLIFLSTDEQKEFLKKIPQFRKKVLLIEYYIKSGQIPDGTIDKAIELELIQEKDRKNNKKGE